MAQIPGPNTVELEDEYYHIRFHDTDEYSEIRTPDWTEKAANEVSKGSKVRTGHRKDSDDWVVQSVLIPNDVGKSTVESAGREIVETLEG